MKLKSVLIALIAALPLFADTYTVDKQHSEASFAVRHFVTNVRGKFDDFSGTINTEPGKPGASSVEFTIKATSIKPGASKDTYEVTGDLTMHGVTKHVTLPVTFLGTAKDPWGNERAGFSLATTLNRQDYGIKWNKALDNGGMMLSDDVKIDINLETVKKK